MCGVASGLIVTNIDDPGRSGVGVEIVLVVLDRVGRLVGAAMSEQTVVVVGLWCKAGSDVVSSPHAGRDTGGR